MILAVDAVADVVKIARDLDKPHAVLVLSERAQDLSRPLADDPRMAPGMLGEPECLDLAFGHLHDRLYFAVPTNGREVEHLKTP